MVEADRLQHRQPRLGNHIGRVVFAAEADFQNQRIGAMAREGENSRRRRDLEKSDRLAGIGRLAFLERGCEFLFRDQFAGKTNALTKLHQMRRRIDMDLETLRLQHGAREGADRALAIGAGDMDDGRQFLFGMAEIGEQPDDPVQDQIDPLGVKRQKPFEDPVAAGVADAHERLAGPGPDEFEATATGTGRVGVAFTTGGGGRRSFGRERFISR